jgi:hypothetical protein
MKTKEKGSALILVVIVTVLLSVVGIMFVMTMRIREMTTSNLADDRDLDTAVGAVAGQIETVLLQDLFGTNLDREIIDGFGGSNEASDSPSADPWLAGLEPTLYDEQVVADPTDDWYQWDQLTNLYGTTLLKWDRILRDGLTGWTLPQFGGIVEDYQNYGQNFDGLPADADGDGVADSMWAEVPNLSTSRGKPVFAAVRIIDNCAMLNLNTANYFQENSYTVGGNTRKGWFYYNYPPDGNYHLHEDSTIMPQYYANGGRYLSEINYAPFLRGSGANVDNPYGILWTKKVAQLDGVGNLLFQLPVKDFHNVLMNIENPGLAYSLFEIGDELEIQNRFLLTSQTISRFENISCAYNTFDFLRGTFTGGWAVDLRVKRIPIDDPTDFGIWKERLNPLNFDVGGTGPNPGYYDRRHVCTFYSFDRNIRSGNYMLLDSVLPLWPDAVETVFRPVHRQPIDLRTMTTLTEPDNIIVPDPNDPAYIINAHKNILHLLYALREGEYFALSKLGGPDPNALASAAKKAAQQVANIIDYQDSDTAAQTGPFGLAASAVYGSQVNADPAYIDRAIIRQMILEVCTDYNTNHPATPIPVIDIDLAAFSAFDFGLAAGEVIYGYERQPFISEVYTCVDDTGVVINFAIELHNPYSTAVNIANWNVVLEAQNASPGSYLQSYAFPAGLTISAGGYVVLRSNPSIPSAGTPEDGAGFGTQIKTAHAIRLLRTNPMTGAADLGVDSIRRNQILQIITDMSDGQDTYHALKRDDRPGVFSDPNAIDHQSISQPPGTIDPGILTLGMPNGLTLSAPSYPLPVANTSMPFDRFADFQRVAYIGNQGGGTNSKAITDIIAQSSDESEIRFDAQLDSELLGYICTLSRKEKGIPGRININTAPLHVIAAAIPPQLIMSASDPNTSLTLAQDIIDHRPYANLAGLLNIQAVKKYVVKAGLNVGDTNIDDDLEERDWIFNRLSNIFTVRSDTFTAYILVRLGTDGPQRRMIAIFDRSNCWTITDKPQLVALHPVPDPR